VIQAQASSSSTDTSTKNISTQLKFAMGEVNKLPDSQKSTFLSSFFVSLEQQFGKEMVQVAQQKIQESEPLFSITTESYKSKVFEDYFDQQDHKRSAIAKFILNEKQITIDNAENRLFELVTSDSEKQLLKYIFFAIKRVDHLKKGDVYDADRVVMVKAPDNEMLRALLIDTQQMIESDQKVRKHFQFIVVDPEMVDEIKNRVDVD